jgi:[acyl-carrier-protein] S-malonyltransferase
LEIGPQRVLTGLMRRIDRTKKALNIEDAASLEKAIGEISK